MPTHPAVFLVARVLLALMFIVSGFGKFAALPGTAAYIASKGLPLPMVLAVGAAALEVVAGLALAAGWHARWAALALALFTLLAAVLFHDFWAVAADQARVQQIMFMKNLAVIGGMLYVFAFGAGPASLDARRGALR